MKKNRWTLDLFQIWYLFALLQDRKSIVPRVFQRLQRAAARWIHGARSAQLPLQTLKLSRDDRRGPSLRQRPAWPRGGVRLWHCGGNAFKRRLTAAVETGDFFFGTLESLNISSGGWRHSFGFLFELTDCGFLRLRLELIKGKVVVLQRSHSLKKWRVFPCDHILSERKILATSSLNFHHCSSSCSRCS